MASFASNNDSGATTQRHWANREESGTGPWTLAVVDAGLAGSLMVVPFFMGGRTPVGQLVFVGIAFWTSLWWALHHTLANGDRTWRSTVAFFPMVVALGLVFLQLVPLSPGLIEKISPHVYEALPLWRSGAPGQTTLGTWKTLTLTPDTTRQSLILLISGILLFTVTVQRIQCTGDVERIIRWLAISVSLMAAFGIVQFLTSNGKFFWIIEHPYSRTYDCVKGAFTNRNHFAQFVSLGFGALLWWTFAGRLERRVPSSPRNRFRSHGQSLSLNTLKAILVPLCALAVLMSFSRGGVLALLVSSTTALYLLLKAGKLRRRTFATLTGLGLVVCLGLSIYGYDVLAKRFESDYSRASLDGRSRLWAAATEGLGDHVLCGTGLSSHGSVYPMYLEPVADIDAGLYYTHAENSYVQIALETGMAGLVLAAATIVIHFFWCAKTLANGSDPRTVLCFVAVLPALLANVVHSTMDYIWYVPGCMAAVAILGGCACRLCQLQRDQAAIPSPARQLPRLAWAGVTVALVALIASSLPGFWRACQADVPWNRYLLLKRSLVQLNQKTAYDDVSAESASRQQLLTAMLEELACAVDLRPDWSLAHASKAQVHRDLFLEIQSTAENEFDLRMIRETVLANFNSVKAAKEWLPRGVGEHWVHLDAALRHAHQAAELGPLEGETYLLLAELSFLEESSVPTKSAYLEQAFRVRPHDGTILFEIGTELALSGRNDQAMLYLKRSFQSGREHQDRLIRALAGLRALAGRVSVTEFLLKEFQPDADALQLMVRHYSRPELAAELECVLAAHAAACESKAQSLPDIEAARYWVGAASSHAKLHNPTRQRDCLQRAVAADSFNFDTHLALGKSCLALEDFDEAAKQFRWCTQRKPGHPGAEKLLEQAVARGIASAHPSRAVEEAVRPSDRARR